MDKRDRYVRAVERHHEAFGGADRIHVGEVPRACRSPCKERTASDAVCRVDKPVKLPCGPGLRTRRR
jgi:hypothetical protein